MRAVVRNTYGSPDVLEFQEIEKPELTDDGVLVRVRAASINPADLYTLTGRPLLVRMRAGLRQPKNNRLGIDFAGTIEDVGKDVTAFRVGDEVFGGESGALAEYVCVRDGFVSKPANLTFEQAAAVPVAAITALQGLRDKGKLQPGQRVLINGASGGVGTFAVQIAKVLGAEVSAVCSPRNVELVRSLGADHVIDYTREDFTRSDRRYDLILDVAGSKPWSQYRRVLNPQATLVIVGAPKGNALLGPLSHIAKVRLASLRSSQNVLFFIAHINEVDLMVLRELLESGKVKPVIDRRYKWSEMADAFRHLGEGHAQGKIVLTI
ncbi:MAG: NAD(P)-dependent alcohol dehydrogenase [Candidatus Nanopelagicaceae bacterium]|nr:NAD(P)-dependent alcohol dehydrogenase [Candidatus Nanopelagicaceae bacterium]